MAADSFDFPDNSAMVDAQGLPSLAWSQLFTRWHRIITAAAQSGVTANRPASLLWIGRPYFDTTLGKPIWVKQVNPSVVWVDAAGTSV
jgi:hypothetical protein